MTLQYGMWDQWADFVAASLPNFAKCPVYVEQTSVPEARFEEVANRVLARGSFDMSGRFRDEEFGARVVKTSCGYVTRMWLESEEEINFALRNLPKLSGGINAVEIGAGYGRLAVPFSSLCSRYVCVDPIPISTQICRDYCARFAPIVEVPSLPDFLALKNRGNEYKFDLAINIHSWNECTLEQIEWWLTMLRELDVPYLFTVSHGQMSGAPEVPYRSHDDVSFRPSLERDYELIAEEALGLSDSPHAFWKRR